MRPDENRLSTIHPPRDSMTVLSTNLAIRNAILKLLPGRIKFV